MFMCTCIYVSCVCGYVHACKHVLVCVWVCVCVFGLVGIMLQISLKISSLCSILFFLYLWFYHYSPLTSKLLNTLAAIHKTFPHSITSLSVYWSLTSSKSLTFTAYNIVQYQKKCPYFAIFIPIFLSGNSLNLTYYAQYFTQSFNILLIV